MLRNTAIDSELIPGTLTLNQTAALNSAEQPGGRSLCLSDKELVIASPVIPNMKMKTKDERAADSCYAFIGAHQRSKQGRNSCCGSSIFVGDDWGGDHSFPVTRTERPSPIQAAQHCSSTALWFRVTLSVISSASITSPCDTVQLPLKWQ